MGTMIRTTVALPAYLLAEADRVVREGRAKSRNEIVALALAHELATIQRRAIDEAFAGMASDIEYQTEASRLMDEFASADQETARTIPE